MKLAIALAILALVAPKVKASGVVPYSLGSSTGTALVVISAAPQSFWGVDVTSSAANDHYKCWNASSTSGLTLSSPATLAGMQWVSGVPGPKGPANQPVNASLGVVCAKDDASSECLIYVAP